MSKAQPSRFASIIIMALAYAISAAVAASVVWLSPEMDPLNHMIYADLAATLVIFIFSVILNNSSLYDPYWSIIPPAIVTYWALGSGFEWGLVSTLSLALVWLWGVRLTWNFLRGWPGLVHEDWRYINIRQFSKKLYWPASLFGIHLFPTAIVFAGLYPLYLAISSPTVANESVIYAGGVLCFIAIALETIADEQLRAFVQSGPAKGSYLKTGLWSVVRHPNYLGENLFWWSLAIMGYGATQSLVCFIGAVPMTAMFVFASIPMIDKRMLERRPAYAEHKAKTPALFPWKGIRPS
jgi:steroid 5-alpha reductase family enzyme